MIARSGFTKIAVAVLFALLLTGCAGAFSNFEVQSVDDSEVLTALHYQDRVVQGPLYAVSMTVPDAWVGEFEVENLGNTINFNYVGDSDRGSYLFSIEALSDRQYWKASGSYPASQTNIVNRGDTYFVYHLPIDAYYSGLSEAEFAAFAAAVPDVIASFAAIPAE